MKFSLVAMAAASFDTRGVRCTASLTTGPFGLKASLTWAGTSSPCAAACAACVATMTALLAAAAKLAFESVVAALLTPNIDAFAPPAAAAAAAAAPPFGALAAVGGCSRVPSVPEAARPSASVSCRHSRSAVDIESRPCTNPK